MKYTERCLVCLDPAITWTGHVMDGAEEVIAGWCDRHFTDGYGPNYLNKLGCSGGWHPRYGKINPPRANK